MDTPREQTFDSYGEYRSAFIGALENAQQTVIIFDPDLRECGLESPQGIAQLERLCSLSTRRDALRILLHSTTWLEQDCPRLTRLLGHYAHCASVRSADTGARLWSQPFLIADASDLVTRFHQDLPRGKRSTDGSGTLAHLATQFETFWMNGGVSAVGTPLAL
ncbi:hypothetical protein LLG90_07975 [Aromatoleum toluclasticum]|uniref:DUF7931 domain-containing protein n=1 Tax=Aromatoleum toluclasticum TaxID=92003 RepID=UPI001D17EEFF|nr:hypothetical protein [Aromatoleum toluclasticum]MCC4115283.1 hypothetical protein [Aromatoleum toluclasticum]